MVELAADEWILRSVACPDDRRGQKRWHFSIQPDGTFPVSRTAFNDVDREPSVDRLSKLTSLEDAKFQATDAIVKLQVADVLKLTNNVVVNEKIVERKHFVLDDPIIGVPELRDRPAHAKIMSDKPIANKPSSEKTYWKNFQELLAIAANNHPWVIPPSDLAIAGATINPNETNPQ